MIMMYIANVKWVRLIPGTRPGCYTLTARCRKLYQRKMGGNGGEEEGRREKDAWREGSVREGREREIGRRGREGVKGRGSKREGR